MESNESNDKKGGIMQDYIEDLLEDELFEDEDDMFIDSDEM